jgi:hypothetical protein
MAGTSMRLLQALSQLDQRPIDSGGFASENATVTSDRGDAGEVKIRNT